MIRLLSAMLRTPNSIRASLATILALGLLPIVIFDSGAPIAARLVSASLELLGGYLAFRFVRRNLSS
jgi:hypothetical protein